MNAEFTVNGEKFSVELGEDNDLKALMEQAAKLIQEAAGERVDSKYLASFIAEKLVDGVALGSENIDLGELAGVQG